MIIIWGWCQHWGGLGRLWPIIQGGDVQYRAVRVCPQQTWMLKCFLSPRHLEIIFFWQIEFRIAKLCACAQPQKGSHSVTGVRCNRWNCLICSSPEQLIGDLIPWSLGRSDTTYISVISSNFPHQALTPHSNAVKKERKIYVVRRNLSIPDIMVA